MYISITKCIFLLLLVHKGEEKHCQAGYDGEEKKRNESCRSLACFEELIRITTNLHFYFHFYFYLYSYFHFYLYSFYQLQLLLLAMKEVFISGWLLFFSFLLIYLQQTSREKDIQSYYITCTYNSTIHFIFPPLKSSKQIHIKLSSLTAFRIIGREPNKLQLQQNNVSPINLLTWDLTNNQHVFFPQHRANISILPNQLFKLH